MLDKAAVLPAEMAAADIQRSAVMAKVPLILEESNIVAYEVKPPMEIEHVNMAANFSVLPDR